jgi:hypothetical protein
MVHGEGTWFTELGKRAEQVASLQRSTKKLQQELISAATEEQTMKEENLSL